eukprot:2273935-Rhodomonas_salina.4
MLSTMLPLSIMPTVVRDWKPDATVCVGTDKMSARMARCVRSVSSLQCRSSSSRRVSFGGGGGGGGADLAPPVSRSDQHENQPTPTRRGPTAPPPWRPGPPAPCPASASAARPPALALPCPQPAGTTARFVSTEHGRPRTAGAGRGSAPVLGRARAQPPCSPAPPLAAAAPPSPPSTSRTP